MKQPLNTHEHSDSAFLIVRSPIFILACIAYINSSKAKNKINSGKTSAPRV